MEIPFSTFWDTDGTKVNSEPVHEIRWECLAKEFGVKLDSAMFDQTHRFPIKTLDGKYIEVNRPLRGAHEDVICYWIIHQMRLQGKKVFPDLAAMKESLFKYYEENAHLIEPREGIPTLIRRLRKEGDLQATVTGCDRRIATINLSRMGSVATSCVDFVVTADNTPFHKPHPAPFKLAFQLAAESFRNTCNNPDITAEMVSKKSVIVEDSPNGVEAGLEAGPPVIQFLNPGQSPFPARKKGYDPSKLFVARTAKEIYEHRAKIRAENQMKGCLRRKRGLSCMPTTNLSSLFVGA